MKTSTKKVIRKESASKRAKVCHTILKVVRIVLISLLSLIIVTGGTIGFIWRHEISTVLNIKQIASGNEEHRDGNVYTIKYSGGYYFDDFLEQGGVSNDTELMAFYYE